MKHKLIDTILNAIETGHTVQFTGAGFPGERVLVVSVTDGENGQSVVVPGAHETPNADATVRHLIVKILTDLEEDS